MDNEKLNEVVEQEQENVDTQEQAQATAKMYSQEEVEKMIQDNVNRAVAKAHTQAEKEFQAKDLKKRGFKFVGPVCIYSFMQAAGLVNDHETGCAFK